MSDLIQICGLWSGTTKGGDLYMSGTLPSGAKFLVFKNKKKEDKHPDYSLYLGKVEKEKEVSDPAPQTEIAPPEVSDELPF